MGSDERGGVGTGERGDVLRQRRCLEGTKKRSGGRVLREKRLEGVGEEEVKF